MSFIQQLEVLGQAGSLKQFDSVSEMLKKHEFKSSHLCEIDANNIELVCYVEPDDDEDEN